MKGIAVNPSETRWAMTFDGEFLCPKCLRENASLINEHAGHDLHTHDVYSLLWAIIGYCGDTVEGLIVNEPDECAHCGEVVT